METTINIVVMAARTGSEALESVDAVGLFGVVACVVGLFGVVACVYISDALHEPNA